MNSCSHQSGVSLVEVLIGMVILSVGLLGLASLQFIAFDSNNEGMFRSQATAAAENMAERLRANSQYLNRTGSTNPALDPGSDNLYTNSTSYNFAGQSCDEAWSWRCHCVDIPATIPNCRDNYNSGGVNVNSKRCSAEELAQYDAWEGSCAVAKIHPLARIQVNCSDADGSDADACSPFSLYTINVSWPIPNNQKMNLVHNDSCPTNSDFDIEIDGTELDQRECINLSLIPGGKQ